MSTSRASRAGGGVVAGATTIYMSSKGVGPNSTAAQNTYAIQAALAACNAAGGGTVVLDRPGVYLVNDIIKADTSTVNYTLNSALVIYSNTTLMLADGVTIKLADASNVYTLRNSGGGNTASGGTTTANSNISIVGGKWDFNYANQTSDPRGLMYWKFHGMWFDYVNGLTVDQVEMVGGKKFCIWQTNCTRIRQSRIYIHATNSDGIHTGGGCTDVVIRDSRFTCPDNATPIITNEGGYYTAIGGGNVYLDAPHGPTIGISFLNNQYPGCPIAPVRLAGGTGTLGTDNIEDVLVDGCTGTSLSVAAVEVIDDTSVSPNITGALVRNLTVRNCRFVATNDASSFTNGFMVYANATGVRDLRLENCTNTDLGFSLKGLTSGGGANATAFIAGEVVTESGTGATGYFRAEDSSGAFVHVYPRTGTFTGAGTPTYTGATSGAVRYNSTSTAPAILGQNMLYIGARCTGVEAVTLANCVDKKAYRGTVYIVASAVVGQLTLSGGAYTLGLDGKLLQIDGTVSSATISGATITGPSTTSSSAVLRVGSTGVATRVAITGNAISGVLYIVDQSSGTLVNVNLSGNTMTGYGSNQSIIVYNRVTTAQTYIGGDGNVFTDRPSGGGGWYVNGINSQSTGAGYVRVNNPSLWIQGSAILAGTPPSLNDRRGDRFFNTDTAGSGAWFTAYGSTLYGQVICANGVYQKHGW